MVRVTGLDVEPLLPPPLPHAVASRAAAAVAANTFQCLTAVSFRCVKIVCLDISRCHRVACASWPSRSGPPDDGLHEPAGLLRRGPQEVQVATVGSLQHVVAVEGGPAAQAGGGWRGPAG